MAIKALGERQLEDTSVKGEGIITLKDLSDRAREFGAKWCDTVVDNSMGAQFALNEKMQIVYSGTGGQRTADLTDAALQQLCARIGGVPSGYIQKCAESGKTELAVSNFSAWAEDYRKPMMFREHDGVLRAALTPKYERYDAWKILKELRYAVDEKRFEVAQAHLSPERFVARFVDFTPLKIKGESSDLYAGFSVSSSDVGDEGLKIVFFLYRFACRNGMLIPTRSGVMYRERHFGANMRMSKVSSFANVLNGVETLIEDIPGIIAAKQRSLSHDDLQRCLLMIKHQMKLSDKAADQVEALIGTEYPRTEWGFMNAITEAAQQYSLERRTELESYAGSLLFAK